MLFGHLQTLPPIRNSLDKKKKQKKKRHVPPTVAAKEAWKPQRIQSGDYKSWDKFDVVHILVTRQYTVSHAVLVCIKAGLKSLQYPPAKELLIDRHLVLLETLYPSL